MHVHILPFWAFMCVYMHATSRTYNKKKLLHNFIFQQNPPAISVAAYTQTGGAKGKMVTTYYIGQKLVQSHKQMNNT